LVPLLIVGLAFVVGLGLVATGVVLFLFATGRL
jgi:hypothetical protein